MFEIPLRFIILGDNEVGKTSILQSLLTEKFNEVLIPTISPNLIKHQIDLKIEGIKKK